jgi:hypothetical protein
MAILLHEVWEEPDGQGNCRRNVCLAGPDGESFRKQLAPGSLCVHTFEADSPMQAMACSHHWLSKGPFPAIQPQDREPYPQEWADRQHAIMTDAERRAYGEIAHALANYAHGMTSAGAHRELFPHVTSPIYHTWSTSAFTRTAFCLWRLKIFRSIGEIENNWSDYFVFDCDLNDARSVAIRNWRSGPLLSTMIENLILLFGYHDDWGFSTEPGEAFGANGRLESTLEALAAIGYLEKLPHGFVWTKRAAGAMYSTSTWPLPGWQPQQA